MKKRKNWFLLGIYVLVVIINVLILKKSQSTLLCCRGTAEALAIGFAGVYFI